ncbi:MAG: YIP1 family protein [Bradyrhizobiaceae bacterium]|nr:YIP1 family protein [Bradyrhizobiaceae bacterium]
MAKIDGLRTILQRAGGILLRPTMEWKAIEREHSNLLLNGYVALLAAIPALSGLIGFSAIGVGVPSLGTVRVPFLSGLLGAVSGYLLAFIVVYVLAVIINVIAVRFDASRSFSAALKLAVYSYTPVWLCGVFLLVPGLRFLSVLGVYGFYVLRRGLPVLMKVPEGRALRYATTIFIVAFVIRILIGWTEAVLFSLPQAI